MPEHDLLDHPPDLGRRFDRAESVHAVVAANEFDPTHDGCLPYLDRRLNRRTSISKRTACLLTRCARLASGAFRVANGAFGRLYGSERGLNALHIRDALPRGG